MAFAIDFGRPEASLTVTLCMALLAVAVAVVIVWLVRLVSPSLSIRVAVLIAAAMMLQLGLASTGVLNHWDKTPPPFTLVVACSILLSVILAFSRSGKIMARDLPFSILIGFEAFRLPLELVMHRAAMEGVMPIQMSYSGFNFDILTGITAIPVAWLAANDRAPKELLVAWNLLGSILLFVIVTIAVLSMPIFHAFGPQRLNTWVTFSPFVWLPGVLVPAALLGHLLLWRKLAIR